jgi:hypothetical protein
VQRQAIARDIGRSRGNHYLQVVLAESMRPTTPEVQRSTTTPRVQRDLLDVLEGIGGFGQDVLSRLRNVVDPIGMIFQQVIDTNIASASSKAIPRNWRAKVARYAGSNPTDTPVLIPAIMRFPAFHSRGWIMKLQPRAAAMTLEPQHLRRKRSSRPSSFCCMSRSVVQPER